METSRQRAAEEARVRREAEWAAFHARERRAREEGKQFTAADRLAAETLLGMRGLRGGIKLRGGLRGGRGGRGRSRSRRASRRRASRTR